MTEKIPKTVKELALQIHQIEFPHFPGEPCNAGCIPRIRTIAQSIQEVFDIMEAKR